MILNDLRLLFQGIGAYTTALIALDWTWWTDQRHWRYLSAGLLALLMMALVHQGTWQ